MTMEQIQYPWSNSTIDGATSEISEQNESN